MATTNIENRAFFSLAGQKYTLFGYVKDITYTPGTTLSKHSQTMTPDGNPIATILCNKAPTLTWTEVVVPAGIYQNLLDLLYTNSGITITIQPYIIGEQIPSGKATTLTGCVIASIETSFPGQDIEGTRKIMINALSYTDL